MRMASTAQDGPVTLCARFGPEDVREIDRIADERFEGNVSMALRWLVRVAQQARQAERAA